MIRKLVIIGEDKKNTGKRYFNCAFIFIKICENKLCLKTLSNITKK